MRLLHTYFKRWTTLLLSLPFPGNLLRFLGRDWGNLKSSFFKHVAYPHWSRMGLPEIRRYWDIRYGGRCRYTMETIVPLRPRSILEIGSNCGNNLVLLSECLPSTEIRGIDINAMAVTFGNGRFRSLGRGNVSLIRGNIYRLPSDSQADLVFTWATLLYVRPRRIKPILFSLLRLAGKHLVLFETHDSSLRDSAVAYGKFYYPNNWKRNYLRIIDDLGSTVRGIETRTIPPDVWSPNGGGGTCLIISV